MAGEKNFENRQKKWLESEGIYPVGEPVDRMSAPPGGIAMVLYPQGFDTFKDIIKGVKSCPQDFPIAGLKCLIVAHSNIGCDMLMD